MKFQTSPSGPVPILVLLGGYSQLIRWNRKNWQKKVIRRIGTRHLDIISECYEGAYDKGQIPNKSGKIL